MKALIFIGIALGGLAGSWVGNQLDGGRGFGFGFWSVLLGWIIGPLLGIYIGYKAAQAWLD